MKVSKNNSEHYVWGNNCDGWHLVKSNDLSIIHEKMPSNTKEVRHLHQMSKQFFFVLSGQATMEVNGEIILLNQHEGITILANTPHQMMNNSDKEIEFIVVSTPITKGDRVLVESL